MSLFKIEATPVIALIERQAFASGAMADALRASFAQHEILEWTDKLPKHDNLGINLDLVIISKSAISGWNEKLKTFQQLAEISDTVPVALLGDSAEQDALDFLATYNLRGIIPDDAPATHVLECLAVILQGGESFSHIARESVFAMRRSIPAAERPVQSVELGSARAELTNLFTPRELAVLNGLATGQPNKAIANELAIAENTIKIHVRNILRKLNVTNRTEAVLTAQRMNALSQH